MTLIRANSGPKTSAAGWVVILLAVVSLFVPVADSDPETNVTQEQVDAEVERVPDGLEVLGVDGRTLVTAAGMIAMAVGLIFASDKAPKTP